LRFSKTGDHNIEDAYARHFVSPRKGSSSILVHSRSVLSNLDLVEGPQFAEVLTSSICKVRSALLSLSFSSLDEGRKVRCTIAVRALEIRAESGFLETGSQGQSVLDGPESLVRFGVAKRAELRIVSGLPTIHPEPSA
jgi:hypothetical protein